MTQENEDNKHLEVAKDDEVTGLKSKNAQLIADNTKYKNSFKNFGGVEAALQLLLDFQTKAKEAEDNKEAEAVKAGQLDAVRAAHDKKVDELTKSNEALKQRFVRAHIDKLVADALTAEKGSIKLLGPHLATAVTGALDKDGDVQVSVRGLDGSALESVHDLVKALRADAAFGAAFEADDMSGGGTRSSNAKVIANPFAKATMDAQAASKLITEKPAEARKLAAAAGWSRDQLTVAFG